MPTLKVEMSAAIHRGKNRVESEATAFCYLMPEGVPGEVSTIAVLGAAGGVGGESIDAVRAFVESVFAGTNERQFWIRQKIPAGDYTALMSVVFEECNRHLLAMADASHRRGSIGATLALGVIVSNTVDETTYLHVANVGNCRGYVIRGEQTFHTTEEDSAAWRLYKKGEITYSELLTHPDRSVITYLGRGETPSTDIHSIELQANDMVIFCTNAVNEAVDDEELEMVIENSAGVKDACRRLIASAVSASKGNNDAAAALASLSSSSANTFVRFGTSRLERMKMIFRRRSVIAVWSLVCVLLIAALAVFFHKPGGAVVVKETFRSADTVYAPVNPRPVQKESALLPLTQPKVKTREQASDEPKAPVSISLTQEAARREKRSGATAGRIAVEWNSETERFRVSTAEASIVPVKLRYGSKEFDLVPVAGMSNLYRTTRPLDASLVSGTSTVQVTLARQNRPVTVPFVQNKEE